MAGLRDFPGIEVGYLNHCGYHTFTLTLDGPWIGRMAERRRAENEMAEWCQEQFGPPCDDPTNERDTRWYLSGWNAFSFVDENQAMAFRLRWM